MLVVDYEHFSPTTIFNITVQHFVRGEVQLEYALISRLNVWSLLRSCLDIFAQGSSFLASRCCYLDQRSSLINTADFDLFFLDIDFVFCPS